MKISIQVITPCMHKDTQNTLHITQLQQTHTTYTYMHTLVYKKIYAYIYTYIHTDRHVHVRTDIMYVYM